MKFELKTEKGNYSRSFSYVFGCLFVITLIVVFCDIALKLGIISRYYQINYLCRLVAVEKSSSSFKKLSRLSNLNSKQLIWEFCKEGLK